MRAKQSLGQNFLMHQATADRIADAASLEAGATVLEIGPGTGMLTASLLRWAGKVIAVETDEELIPSLKERFAKETGDGRLEVVAGDIRSFDLDRLPDPYHVVANIPYYITGEIVRLLLSARHKPASVTLLVQKEVAERIARDAKESLLSLSVKVYGSPKYVFTVPRGAFRPAPKVDSAVLFISHIHAPFADNEEEAWFFKVLQTGFGHKRKQLAKNLTALRPSERVVAALHEAGLSVQARAEDVPLESWRTLARMLA